MKNLLIKYWNEYSHFLPGLGRSLLVSVLIIIGGKILKNTADKMIQKAVASSRIRIDETLGTILRLIVNYAVIFICAIMILGNFGFNTAGLITLLGAAGVTIGLALQATLSNIASGIILLVLHPFKRGDLIEFGTVNGTVKELGLFVTLIETVDGIHISVPNSNLWGPPLRNYSKNPRRRLELSLTVSFGNDLDNAIALLEEIARGEKRFLPQPPPQVVIHSMGDSGGPGTVVTIKLLAWVPSELYMGIYQDLLRVMREKITNAELATPVPRRVK